MQRLDKLGRCGKSVLRSRGKERDQGLGFGVRQGRILGGTFARHFGARFRLLSCLGGDGGSLRFHRRFDEQNALTVAKNIGGIFRGNQELGLAHDGQRFLQADFQLSSLDRRQHRPSHDPRAHAVRRQQDTRLQGLERKPIVTTTTHVSKSRICHPSHGSESICILCIHCQAPHRRAHRPRVRDDLGPRTFGDSVHYRQERGAKSYSQFAHNPQGVLSGIPGGTEALNLERFPEAPRLTFESTNQSEIPSRRRA